MPISADSSVPAPLHRAIYLTGPTASGKTGIGVALARRLDAEIIAMDSMTLYRGMDIGMAKATPEEQGGGSPPDRRARTLAGGQCGGLSRWALKAVADIESRGQTRLVRRRDGPLSQGLVALGCSRPVVPITS